MEDIIDQVFIPAFPCSPTERKLYVFPVRLGGLDLINPCSAAHSCFCDSEQLITPLVALIVTQYATQTVDHDQIHQLNQSIRRNNHEHHRMVADTMQSELPPLLNAVLTLPKNLDPASSWLTVLPILEHGFHLHKGDFGMLCLCVMASHHLIHPVLASMEPLSQLTMLWYTYVFWRISYNQT